jgi:6,7-dimethyl-8-ribityllumazine synthase
MSDSLRVLIVEARFYDDLADALLDGAVDVLRAQGVQYDVVSVPGALEVPPAIALAEEAGRYPTAPRYDGYVALGCVIRGETYHFEIVSDQSAAGLMQLGLKGLAIGNGILTTEDEDQAWARARRSEGDKGGGAARACLDLIALRKRLRVGLGA